MKGWVCSRSNDGHALVQLQVVKVCFWTRRHDGTNLDSHIDQIPNTWTALVETLSLWKTRDLLQRISHVTLERDKQTLCAS